MNLYMHKFYNCILFILLIAIVYFVSKKKHLMIKSYDNTPILDENVEYIHTQNAKDYTKQVPNIHTTTNMFQIN